MTDAPRDGRLGRLAADLDARTPAGRERYIDLLRAFAILTVVLGHWLAAVVTVDAGRIGGTNLLAVAPETKIATWFVQVMPVFFLVAGYSAAVSCVSAERRSTTWLTWTTTRISRLLLAPTAFIVIVIACTALARLAGAPADIVSGASRLIAFSLWFLAVYIPLVALAPLAVRAQRRWGHWVAVGLALLVVAVDLLRLKHDVAAVGWANFLLVFGFALQLGIAWRLGAWSSLRSAALVFAGGLAALIACVAMPAYPLSMVTVPGAAESNASPPSLAMLALGIAQTGVVLLLREPGRRWCARPYVWLAAVVVNRRIVSIYLWQLVPVLAAAPLLYLTGWFPTPPPASIEWWLLRPIWLLILLAIFLPILLLTRRFETSRTSSTVFSEPGARTDRRRTTLAVGAVAALSLGLARFTWVGLSTGNGFAGLPLEGIAEYTVGLVLLRAARRTPDQT